MIKLKINNKTTEIPTMDELTVKQFIELSKQKVNIVTYLSVTLGISYKDSFNTKVKGVDKLLKRLGKMEDYTKIPPRKKLIVDNVLVYIKDISISTVGQRFMIEENNKSLDNEELLCFIMAIGIVDDPMDVNKVNELKDKLLNEPYKKILPAAFFLANRFLIGRKNAMNYLRMSRQLINMRLYEIKQVFSNWHHILIIMRFKRFVIF